MFDASHMRTLDIGGAGTGYVLRHRVFHNLIDLGRGLARLPLLGRPDALAFGCECRIFLRLVDDNPGGSI